jgi:hypothetical protein
MFICVQPLTLSVLHVVELLGVCNFTLSAILMDNCSSYTFSILCIRALVGVQF